MSSGDFEAVRDKVADQIADSTRRVTRLCNQISELTVEGAEKDRRILELSAKLHTYDAIAGAGVRADGEALRKRIDELETELRDVAVGIETADNHALGEDWAEHIREVLG